VGRAAPAAAAGPAATAAPAVAANLAVVPAEPTPAAAAMQSVYGRPSERSQQQHQRLCQLMRAHRRCVLVKSEGQRNIDKDPPDAEEDAVLCHAWKLQAAYSEFGHGVTTLSHVLGKSRREVRRGVASAALFWLRLQSQRVARLLQHLVANHPVVLELFVDHLAWDETVARCLVPSRCWAAAAATPPAPLAIP